MTRTDVVPKDSLRSSEYPRQSGWRSGEMQTAIPIGMAVLSNEAEEGANRFAQLSRRQYPTLSV
jgi:hypothetical protein